MASIETSKPGLFNIGLNIGKEVKSDALSNLNKQLADFMKSEPVYMKPAIRNMQAVLLFQMDLGTLRAHTILEELVTENPKDLNPLSDLIYVCKNMGYEEDADWYGKKLEEHKCDRLSQARSILSQAHALTFDLIDEQVIKPEDLLKKAWRQLNKGYKHSHHLSEVNKSVVGAYREVKMIPKSPFQDTINAKEIAVEKLERGIEMLENIGHFEEEILVWKHILAITRGRLDNWRYLGGIDDEHRVNNWIKALEAHLDVIENLSTNVESLKTYAAKSCAFFAQLYTSRKQYHSGQTLRIKSQNPYNLLCKALSLCPNNRAVLHRCARYYHNNNKFWKAITLHDKSISLIPDLNINLFSYTGRSESYFFYANRLTDTDERDRNLGLAYNDCKIAITIRCDVVGLKRMAAICFARANPDLEPVFIFRCQNINFIYEALEALNEATEKNNGNKNSKIQSNLGRYYPYIDKYRRAIESLKIALELSEWRDKWAFSSLYKSFVAFYTRQKDTNLLGEFRFMLKEAKKRRCGFWIKDAMDVISRYCPEFCKDLIQNIRKWDLKGCDLLIKHELKIYFPRNMKMELHERTNQELDMNGPMEIQKSQTTNYNPYDFFILYSDKEQDWVNYMLRPQMEDYDDMIIFKGFFPSRDFLPGKKVRDSLVEGLELDCKLLVVLTPNFLENYWQKYSRDDKIFSIIEKKIQEKTIILIILEKCCIPKQLEKISPIFFTENSDWETLRMCLTE